MDTNFPVLSYNENELLKFAHIIMRSVGSFKDKLGIKQQKLQNLFQAIQANYNVNPYHNFTHGFSVYQMFSSLCHKTQLSSLFNEFECFIGLIACLGHDIRHSNLLTSSFNVFSGDWK